MAIFIQNSLSMNKQCKYPMNYCSFQKKKKIKKFDWAIKMHVQVCSTLERKKKCKV